MRGSDMELFRRFIVTFSILSALVMGLYVAPPTLLARDQEGGFSVATVPEVEEGGATGSYSDLGDDRHRDWQHLVFTGYTGPRIRVSLGEVKDRTGLSEASARDAGGDSTEHTSVPVGVIKERLRAAITRANRFDVEALEAPGSTEPAQRSSGVQSAPEFSGPAPEYLVSGLVTEWSIHGRASLAGDGPSDEMVARAAIVLRIADVTTGQVLFATEEQAETNLRNTDRSVAVDSLLLIDEKDTAFRSAMEACINKGVYRLVDWFQQRPWTARVSRVEGDRVYVNAGRNQGLDVGMTLRMLAARRQIIDSETGSILGSVTRKQGRMVIVDIYNDVAVAEIIEECDGIKPGDRVELQPSQS